ncbi:MAG: aldo/keto reductase [Pirellulales bacterium]|nr:aldo/keto reductase [Pirellulales bacterium]
MNSINRRNFLGATASAAVLSRFGYAEQPPATPPAPAPVQLGATDIPISRVGLGTGLHGGNRQSDHSRLGFQKLVSLFRHAWERGITFFDMADLYGTHLYCREALRSIPREKVAILTKIWWRYDQPRDQANSPERHRWIRTTIERFRHEIATDYLDIVLLHCLDSPTWDRELTPYMEVLDEEKAKKRVRAVGVSCHHIEALKTAAFSPWVDVILARINFKGVKMDGTTDEVIPILREAKKNGKSVIGMKIFGEGTLSAERETCIQFAQELGLLDAMTIGCLTPDQIDDVLQLLHKYPATGPAMATAQLATASPE